MRLSASILLPGLAVLIGFQSAPAAAEDFTIIVPVQVSNLPDEARPRVRCVVYGESLDDSDLIGFGFAERNDNADFNGTMTVAFDAEAGRNPDDARQYVCELGVDPNSFSHVLSWESCESAGIVPADDPLFCGARGAPANGRIRGDL